MVWFKMFRFKIAECYNKIRFEIAEWHNAKCMVYIARNQYHKAYRACVKALKVYPDYPYTYNHLGVIYHNCGENELAILYYKQAIILKPNDPDFYYNIGIVYQAENDVTNAIKAYQHALRLDPSFILAYGNLTTLLIKKPQYQQALQGFSGLLALQPDENYQNMVTILQKLIDKQVLQ